MSLWCACHFWVDFAIHYEFGFSKAAILVGAGQRHVASGCFYFMGTKVFLMFLLLGLLLLMPSCFRLLLVPLLVILTFVDFTSTVVDRIV
ncbi:unnamed protein product [Malus baccata var. baccata]